MVLRRKQFEDMLKDKTGLDVYFRPPTGYRIPKYPCIIFDILPDNYKYADNQPYITTDRYRVHLLTRDPDDQALDILRGIPYSKLVDSRQTAGINDYTFYIYF